MNVQTRERAASSAKQPLGLTRPHGRGRRAFLGGGTDGNEQLTAITGVVLILLLAVIGITILRVRQLISIHLFVGLLLIGPVALKIASTAYRFMRYYTRDRAYAQKGPPEPILRMIAPVVLLSTVGVFVTGVLLLFGGANSKNQYLELHKITFIIWIVFTGLHVLGHLPGLPRSVRAVNEGGGARGTAAALRSPGEAGRWLVLLGALVGGIVLAIALIPDYHSWQHAAASFSGHDG